MRRYTIGFITVPHKIQLRLYSVALECLCLAWRVAFGTFRLALDITHIHVKVG